LVRGLGVRAVLDEPHDDLRVLVSRGSHQGRPAIVVGSVDVCTALLDEALHARQTGAPGGRQRAQAWNHRPLLG
jgi:hypothetical protein